MRQPLLEGLGGRRLRADEVLHLHLLELAHPEDEVARRDLVAERLADLGDPERQLLARRLLDVLEVDVRALRGLRAQVDDRGVLLDRAHERLEHQVEPARRRERAAVVRALEAEPLDDGRVLELGRGQVLGAGELVEPEPAVVGRALDERIAERADVAGRDPDLRVHQDPGIEPDDVVALLDHRPPPGPLDVVLELDAEGPVVPHGVDAAVDLARGEDEAAPLGERHDRVEVGDGGRDVVGSRVGVVTGVSADTRPWQGRAGCWPPDASRAGRTVGFSPGSVSARSRSALPPMTLRDVVVLETRRRAARR